MDESEDQEASVSKGEAALNGGRREVVDVAGL